MKNTTTIDTYKFGEYSITLDNARISSKITKPSPRSRMGVKVVSHFRFATIERMQAYVEKFMVEATASKNAKQVKQDKVSAARKNFTSPYKIGQILYDSWGYDQTNIGYYQVVEVKGKTIVVREVSQKRTYSQSDAGSTMPVANDFIGKEQKKNIQIRCWSEKVEYSVKNLSNWDGQPKYWSSYH